MSIDQVSLMTTVGPMLRLEEQHPEMYTNDYGDDYSVVKRTHLFATEQEALFVNFDVHSSV